jgi:hypothetical protein
MESIGIEAPEDSIVIQIAPEGRVAVNQRLIVLKSPRLEQHRSSLLALEEHLSYLERPFNDGRIDEEIAALAQKEQFLADAVTLQEKILDFAQLQFKSGQTSIDTPENAEVKLIQSRNARTDAHLASSHAARKKVDLQDKITTAKNKIGRDKQFLDTMDKSLTISSSVSGTFYPNTLVNYFVRKGHLLGKINL